MSRSNGRANGKDVVSASETQIATLEPTSGASGFKRFTADDIKRYTSELEVPFDPHVIEWRVTNGNQQKTRGQVVPYADQRAYTDRLNAVFTPAGWTRKYTIHTSANFERSRDQKIVAKVLVSCELTIFGLGLHSATGEEWADNDNAGTCAERRVCKQLRVRLCDRVGVF
jgi:Rad52/22 family double-strand break repair protein